MQARVNSMPYNYSKLFTEVTEYNYPKRPVFDPPSGKFSGRSPAVASTLAPSFFRLPGCLVTSLAYQK